MIRPIDGKYAYVYAISVMRQVGGAIQAFHVLQCDAADSDEEAYGRASIYARGFGPQHEGFTSFNINIERIDNIESVGRADILNVTPAHLGEKKPTSLPAWRDMP